MTEYRAVMKHKKLHPGEWINVSLVKTYHTYEGAKKAIEIAKEKDPDILETQILSREVTPWIRADAD